MVVLELGDLEERPSLLVAVMFSLIIYIENRMYQSSREQKKLCVIDEGWKLLDFKNKKVGDFIEKGYRTARRHTGSYITPLPRILKILMHPPPPVPQEPPGVAHRIKGF